MRTFLHFACAAISTLSAISSTNAASIQVAPVSLELLAPTSAGTLKLENKGGKALGVQLRVFRWSQVGGQEKLEPTKDVVVSPPIVQVASQASVTVRVLRPNKNEIVGEENYRVLIDELPDPATRKNGVVSIVLRQSIPISFRSQTANAPQVTWAVETNGGRSFLTAHNSGERKLRVSQLKLSGSGGRSVVVSEGLVGYVLGGSSMRWPLSQQASRLASERSLTISAQGNVGPISATAPVTAR